nr:MAG TPA: hypothetical protein [Caudoviricetes sp.]
MQLLLSSVRIFLLSLSRRTGLLKKPTRDASPPLVFAFPVRLTGKKANLKSGKGLLFPGIFDTE